MTFLQQTHQAHLERSIRLGVPRASLALRVAPQPAPTTGPVTTTSIARLSARRFGVPFSQVMGPCRRHDVSHARKVAMYLARVVLQIPIGDIALRLDKSPGAVSDAIHHLVRRMRTNPLVRSEVAALERRLRARLPSTGVAA
jgi:chromosomal replication initiation ATPase DnaA